MSERRREQVYELLDGLGIPYRTIEHPPLFTQADSEAQHIRMDTVVFKNLFLRNKDKSRYYLYALPLEKRADLVALAKDLNETRLSFGDEEVLYEKLRIRHGAVSFLNVIGVENTDVVILIDSSALSFDTIGVHPNDNTATVVLRPQDIQAVLQACGVDYRFIGSPH